MAFDRSGKTKTSNSNNTYRDKLRERAKQLSDRKASAFAVPDVGQYLCDISSVKDLESKKGGVYVAVGLTVVERLSDNGNNPGFSFDTLIGDLRTRGNAEWMIDRAIELGAAALGLDMSVDADEILDALEAPESLEGKQLVAEVYEYFSKKHEEKRQGIRFHAAVAE